MSEQRQFRTRSVMVSTAVFEACRALSEVEGYSCVDEFVDLRLALHVSNEKDIKWLTDQRKERMKKLREDYKARIENKTEDQIPGL